MNSRGTLTASSDQPLSTDLADDAIDPRATMKRITWRIMPLIMSCYLFAFFDRINISFAKFQLQGDLGLSDTAYGLGASLFVFGYVLFRSSWQPDALSCGCATLDPTNHDLLGTRHGSDGFRAHEMAVLRAAISDRCDGSRLRARRAVLPDALVSGRTSRTDHISALSRLGILGSVWRARLGVRAGPFSMACLVYGDGTGFSCSAVCLVYC
jgi:hypothetical protein